MSQVHPAVFQLDLQPTLGAWFIGAIASVGLLGVICLQSWTYFLRFPNDPNIIKALVLTVWALVFAKCVVSVHAGYFLGVVKWGDIPELLTPIWSMKVMVLLSSAIMFLVHLFFAHKIWMLTRKRYWWLPVIILVFSLAHFGLGAATFFVSLVNTSYEAILFGQAGRIATAALGCVIITDWTITISLVIFLRAEKGPQLDIGFTKKFLSTLIFYAINIGFFVSLADLVVLVLLNVKFKSLNLYQLMTYEIVGDLYANTLLACLNMRSAPSTHELSRFAKSRHSDFPSSRALIHQQSIGASRHSPTGRSYESDRSAIAMDHDIKKGGTFDTFPLIAGCDNKGSSYRGVRTSPDWESGVAITRPDIVVTKATVTTVV